MGDVDPRPCKGDNSNICVAEGCFGEDCLKDCECGHKYGCPRHPHLVTGDKPCECGLGDDIKPLDLGTEPEAKMFVQKVGMRWKSWVEVGFCTVQGEYGTYSWTQKRAEAKARKLLAYATREPNPKIEVRP